MQKLHLLVHVGRRRRINDIADVVGQFYGSVQEFLRSELNMCRVSVKFDPRLLTIEQKEHYIEV